MLDFFGSGSFTSKDVTLISTVMATLFGFLTFVWKKAIAPTLNFFSAHEELVKSVDVIKKEVLPNGGNSLKDTVNSLNITCERIEERQKVIEQRSRIALHYHDQPIFETDAKGFLLWNNEEFYNLTCDSIDDLEGCNWINYVQAKDRSKFIKEFESCSEMCRKFEFETRSTNNKKIKFTGTPYKTSESSHMGFIFNLSLIGE